MKFENCKRISPVSLQYLIKEKTHINFRIDNLIQHEDFDTECLQILSQTKFIQNISLENTFYPNRKLIFTPNVI